MTKEEVVREDFAHLPEDFLADLIDAAILAITRQKAYHKFAEEKEEPLTTIAKSLDVSKTTLSKSRSMGNQVKKDFRADCIGRIAERYKLIFYQDRTVAFPTTTSTDHLKALAEKLALNLVDVSTKLGDTLTYRAILEHEHLWKRREQDPIVRRERFIAIVGAGASNAATPERNPIPDAAKAIEQIKEAFNETMLKKLIDEKVQYLRSRLEYASDAEFELQMKALIGLSPERVIDKLQKICGFKHSPSLLYEIMAHLLKHRFLDAIVNFNYDELLDNAIQEELPNRDDYNFIYTAGHCPNKLEELYIGHRIKQPLYIKCHGTISHPNSLRFRETDAFTIEKAIQQHLEDLLLAKMPDKSGSNQKELPINLLVFGFGMNNQVFNQLLNKVGAQKREKIHIWLFDKNPELERKVYLKLSAMGADKQLRIEVTTIPLDQHESMEGALEQLWKHIYDCFKKPYKPRGIARHELVNHVFTGISPLDLSDLKERKSYLKDRLIVEIVLLLLQSDGILHLRQLSNNRGGKVYNLLRELGEEASLQEYLKKMGLVAYKGFMYDTFLIEERENRENEEELVEYLRKKLRKNLAPTRRAMLTNNMGKEFKRLAKEVRKRRLAIVNPKYINVHDNLFSEINQESVMNTSLAWIYNYRARAEKHNTWDLLLAITEQGRFLKYDLNKGSFADKHLELILATRYLGEPANAYEEQLKSLNLLSQEVLYRPWWLHNKHMVIFLERRKSKYTGNWKKDWKLVEGYFYVHRMLSRRINPVRVTEKEDLRKLLYMYGIYWGGAREYCATLDSEKPSMGVVAGKREIEAILKELFALYEQRTGQ